MRFRNKLIADMPLEKMTAMADSFSKVSDSKVLTDSEEKEIKAQILSFGRAVTKCGDGHIVPPELKPTVEKFEKADFDITKLPDDLKLSLAKTYDDLKKVSVEHEGEFKKTQVKVFCSIYEFFTNAKNIKFLNRIRKDDISKKANISKENFDETGYLSLRSLEEWLADEESTQSCEGIGTSIAAIKTAFIKLSASINGTLVSVQTLATICAILLLVAIVLISALLIINMHYKSELADILKEIAGTSASSTDYRYTAAKNMVEHTNPLTKVVFYKPISGSISAFEKITEKGYNWFDKALNDAKKSKSKESLDESQEVLPGFLGAAAAWIAGLTVPFWIIFSIVCVCIFIKPAVYFIYRLKLKGYEFFKNEADMLLVNIEDLEDKYKSATSDLEKERLQKIIDKQRTIYQNLSSIANWFYKAQQEAAMDTRDDMRDCDSTDYDRIVDETSGTNESNNGSVDIVDSGYSTPDPIDNSSSQSNGTRKPSVIF